jgi:hypothetical protein
MPSSTIHKQGFPRDLPAGFAEDFCAGRVDEDLSADKPCQSCPMVNTPWLATRTQAQRRVSLIFANSIFLANREAVGCELADERFCGSGEAVT